MQSAEPYLSLAISMHTFIISWPGFEAKAREIEEHISQQPGKVNVIHSRGDSGDFEVPPHWVILPNDAFYGAKFFKSLELCSGEIMLQIQADAHCDDWPEVIRRCRLAFGGNPDLGLWAPLVDWTPWSIARTFLEKPKKGLPVRVSMVDGIVWALGVKTLERMKQIDFSMNPLGRGIDLAAASFAMAHGFDAVVDPRVKVAHPRGSGSSETDANQQLEIFLAQLSAPERLARQAIQKLQGERIRREKQSLSYIANKLFRRILDPLYKGFKSIPKAPGKKLK